VTSQEAVIGGYDPMYDTLAEYFDPNADLGGGTGTVTVTGEGSSWATEILMVGFSGEGTLEILDGGQVEDHAAWIGVTPDVNGIVEVSGPNSVWTNEAELVVGVWGEGDVTIEDGAQVTAGEVYIGGVSFELLERAYDANYIPDGTGTVTVTGTGSTLNVAGSDTLYVGYSGEGTLDVNEGGQVAADAVVLGGGPDAVGIVTVDGVGSQLTADWEIVVGAWGEGNLTVANGGQVTTDTMYIGGFDVNEADFDPNMLADFGDAEGTGTVTVTGEGSQLQVSEDDSLYVGYTGTGTLEILNGGQVSSEYGYIAFTEGSEGTVNVIGDGSSLEVVENLYVGIGEDSGMGGTGLLVVQDGGLVNVGDTLIIGPTGKLQGAGTVQAGTLNTSGTIAPGDSIGTMTVEGNVVFEPNSIFEVEINNTSSDKLIVTGDVDIQGGTVKAVEEGTIVGSHEYQIIEANEVTGTFDVLDTALVHSVTDANLGYDDTSVLLYITAMAFDDPNVCQTTNQKAIGPALQQIAEDEGGNDITEALQELGDFEDVRGAYDQLCGQIRPTLGPITTSITSNFIGVISGGLDRKLVAQSNRLGGRALLAMARPDSMTGAVTMDVSAFSQFIAMGNGTNILGDKPWGIWVKSYGMFGDRDSEDGVNGYRYTIYGFGMGVDYQFTENLLMGITSGFSDGQVDYYNSKDESKMKGLHLGLYGRWASERWYANALLAYTGMEYDTDRYVDLTGEHLSGDPDGYDLAGYVEAGLTWRNVRGWQINPMVALQWSSLSLDDYAEKGGSSALTFDSEHYKSFKSSLGARVTKVISEKRDGVKAVWEVRGRWVHEFDDVQSTVDTAFITNPDVIFKVSDSELPRDSAVFGMGLNASLNEQTVISLEYDVRLNADDKAHLLGLALQYRW